MYCVVCIMYHVPSSYVLNPQHHTVQTTGRKMDVEIDTLETNGLAHGTDWTDWTDWTGWTGWTD